MTNLTLHIENNATLDALLPLLKHLGIAYSTREEQVVEPAVMYQTPIKKVKKRLEDTLVSKINTANRESILQTILDTKNPIVNLEERLQHLKECRTNRPMPSREEI